MSDLDKFVECLTHEKLSPITILEYGRRLKRFIALIGSDEDSFMEDIMTDPEKYSEVVINKIDNIKTRKNLFAIILSLFKYCPNEMKEYACDDEEYNETLALWRNGFKMCDDILTKSIETNLPSERQADTHIEWQNIIDIRNNLPPGSTEKLLLCMYSMIPPMRSDYGDIKIYSGSEPIDSANYIIINKSRYTLVITKYKTSKTYGTLTQDLPKELIKELKLSLKINPRTYLFENEGKPYNNIQFNKFANKTFKKIFGKAVTINTLRHSFISNLDINNMSIEERKSIGLKMGHNWDQQEKYKLLFNKKSE